MATINARTAPIELNPFNTVLRSVGDAEAESLSNRSPDISSTSSGDAAGADASTGIGLGIAAENLAPDLKNRTGGG